MSDIKREIDALSRDPFRNVLADVLSCAPTPADIRKHARKSPDRWAQMLSIIARLGGYHEKLEIDGSAKVSTLSDAEIEQRIQQLMKEALTDVGHAVPSEPRHIATQADGRSADPTQAIDNADDITESPIVDQSSQQS